MDWRIGEKKHEMRFSLPSPLFWLVKEERKGGKWRDFIFPQIPTSQVTLFSLLLIRIIESTQPSLFSPDLIRENTIISYPFSPINCQMDRFLYKAKEESENMVKSNKTVASCRENKCSKIKQRQDYLFSIIWLVPFP